MVKKDRGVSDVPGNAMASAALVQRELMRIGEGVLKVQNELERAEDHDLYLKAIRAKTVDGASGEWFFILTADSGDGPVVSFVHADTLAGGLVTIGNKLRNGSMKWRPDEFAK